MPALSVVIPTLGRHTALARALASFERQSAAAESFEVIVVADAAEPEPDALARVVGQRPYPVRLLRGERPGASAARNRGVGDARGELVLFTDDDILAGPRLVAEHLAAHRREPVEEVAVLGHVRWARELRVTPFMRWLDRGTQFDYANIRGGDAGWGRFYCANASIKRAFLERLGGFDEERLPYLYEDLDLAYRGSRLGLRVLYRRQAEAEHLQAATLESWQRRAAVLARAERRFTAIHPEIPPFFHRMFVEAGSHPEAGGRGVPLLRYVPPRVPVIGPRVWASAHRYFAQALAPYFLEAWEGCGSAGTDPEIASSSGSPPSGPK